MRLAACVLSRVAAGLFLGLSLAGVSTAQTPIEALADTVARVEERLGARVGLSLVETGSELSWAHRGDERFPMNSTAKMPICGAVLARRDAGELSLSDALRVRREDILSYAPVTEKKVGSEMTVAELCLAALDMSDNTAANMLLDRIGGPQAVTGFLRSIGDEASRLDRREPELNAFAPGDPRDATSPVAMTGTLRRLLLGDALSPDSRKRLAEWMSHGGVTGSLLHAEAPDGWRILDKSGAGGRTRSIVAVVAPDDGTPWAVAIFISGTDADFAARNAALREIGGAVMTVIRN